MKFLSGKDKTGKKDKSLGHTIVQTGILTGLSYLLGSVPFSYIVARTRGVDLRTVGSGNIGSSNVWRSCGFKPFLAAVTCDILKGTTLPLLAIHKLRMAPAAVVLVGAGAILGHTFSLFMGFKGGKAVATSGGVLLAIFPIGTLVGATVWFSLLKITRISSISSLSATAAVFTTALIHLSQGKLDRAYAVFIVLSSGAIVYLHRSNIQRLLEGRENKFQTFLH